MWHWCFCYPSLLTHQRILATKNPKVCLRLIHLLAAAQIRSLMCASENKWKCRTNNGWRQTHANTHRQNTLIRTSAQLTCHLLAFRSFCLKNNVSIVSFFILSKCPKLYKKKLWWLVHDYKAGISFVYFNQVFISIFENDF